MFSAKLYDDRIDVSEALVEPINGCTTEEQESEVLLIIYEEFEKYFEKEQHLSEIHFESHVNFVRQHLELLPTGWQTMEPSRVWMSYWLINSLDLLKEELNEVLRYRLLKFLKRCFNERDGSFGGSPLHAAHVASTYAAVNSICILKLEEGYEYLRSIRNSIFNFFMKMLDVSGGFHMQVDGEIDVRGSYCVLSVLSLLDNINEIDNDRKELIINFILQCQTYEGGFGATPTIEAHGGYTFCSVAALKLLNSLERSHINSLIRWLVKRQMFYEGGLNGRTNKLVDSCYSFWQGGTFILLEKFLPDYYGNNEKLQLLNRTALRDYILICAQTISGGFRDKPGKAVDFYHTCYSLNGLGLTQLCDVKELNEIYGISMESYEAMMKWRTSNRLSHLTIDNSHSS
ncbi:hypothetical protein SNEBB_004520 [Seison nebaliae]|nr:hypothetical protein SNEBB_004520 [Seison nebaliae]